MNKFLSFIFIVVAFLPVGNAQTIKGALTILEDPAVLKTGALACSGGEDPYLNCASALCGGLPDEPNHHPTKKMELGRSEKSELEALVTRSIERKKEIVRLLKTSHREGKLALFDHWDDSNWETQANLMFRPLVNPSVDMTKPIGRRVSFLTTDPPSPGLKVWLEGYAKLYESAAMQMTLGALTVIEARKLVQAQLNELRSDLDKLSVIEKMPAQFRPDMSNIQKKDFAELLRISDFVSNVGKPFLAPTKFCASTACRAALRTATNSVIESKLSKFEADLLSVDQNQIADKVDKCLSRQLITPQYVSKANEYVSSEFPRIRDEFLKQSTSLVCPALQDKFHRYMQSLKPNLSLEDKLESWSALKNKLEKSLLTTQSVSEIYSEWDLQGTMNDLDGICSNKPFTQDQFDGSSMEIFISPDTVIGKNKRVLYHELGHALSRFMIMQPADSDCRKNYEKKRKCVSQRRPSAAIRASVFQTFSDDTDYSEEDMADFIASKLDPAIRPKDQCTWLNKKTPLDPLNHLEAMSMGSSLHSPHLLRTLWNFVDKKLPLPVACKDLIGSKLTNYKWEKCD